LSDGPAFLTLTVKSNPAESPATCGDDNGGPEIDGTRSASVAMARVAGAPDEAKAPESAADAEIDPVADGSGVIEKVMSAGV
jgi:hypothetical protein